MSNSKIKVIGYTQKIVYDNGIEYRNFNPDLVGLQIASRGGSPLLTFGNFSVTTNLEPKSDKFFITNKFSNFYTLNTLSTTLQNSSTIINDNEKAYLNLDKRKLNYYALFGSLSEFIRVGLENIITNWPASLYLQPNNIDQNGNPTTNFTIQDYAYDNVNQTATFRVDTNAITNNFNLNYTNNTNQTNTLKNLTLNYRSYVVNFTGDTEYDIIGFTGATNNFNSNVYIKVSGDPFFGLLPRITWRMGEIK